jgi:hypothetical protein
MSLKAIVVAAAKPAEVVTVNYPCLRMGILTCNIYLCHDRDHCYRVSDGSVAPTTTSLNVRHQTVPFIGTVTLTSE